MNYATSANEALITYEYSQWAPASEPDMPYGCQSFDVLRGRNACRNFSSWVSDQTRPGAYASADDAFTQLTAEGSGGNIGHPSYAVTVGDVTFIPFHYFQEVWSVWPESTQVPNWEECFGFADEDHSDFIDQREFAMIYALAGTTTAVTEYCRNIREHHEDSFSAWLGASGAYKSIPLEIWQQHWEAYRTGPTGGFG